VRKAVPDREINIDIVQEAQEGLVDAEGERVVVEVPGTVPVFKPTLL
jgi:hypothetical protein